MSRAPARFTLYRWSTTHGAYRPAELHEGRARVNADAVRIDRESLGELGPVVGLPALIFPLPLDCPDPFARAFWFQVDRATRLCIELERPASVAIARPEHPRDGDPMYDPRRDPSSGAYRGTGEQSRLRPASWEPSTNPAILAANSLVHGSPGVDTAIFWSAVADAADLCDNAGAGAPEADDEPNPEESDPCQP